MTTTITDLDDFKALDPFFRIIEKGLDGIADGGHFFDLLAENVIFDYVITTPGYPRRVEGRKAVDSYAVLEANDGVFVYFPSKEKPAPSELALPSA